MRFRTTLESNGRTATGFVVPDEVIDRDRLRTALEGGTVTVVDALPAAPYGARHIPGALDLVAEEVEAGA